MTLHGASGTDDEDLRQAIGAGITVVHINTEVRVAWRYGMERPSQASQRKSSPTRFFRRWSSLSRQSWRLGWRYSAGDSHPPRPEFQKSRYGQLMRAYEAFLQREEFHNQL